MSTDITPGRRPRGQSRQRSQRRGGRRFPRMGEKVTDGYGGTYPVVAAKDGRLLLRDTDGLCFVMHTHRLKTGSWRVVS